MKMILVIFKKELLDILRDHRTIIAMILIPFLLFPVLMGVATKFMRLAAKEKLTKTLNVGLVTNGNAEEFRHMLQNRDDIKVIEDITVDSCQTLIKSQRLDAAIVFEPDFDKHVSNLLTGKISIYFESTEEKSLELKRLLNLLHKFKLNLRVIRFKRLDLDKSTFKTVEIKVYNLTQSNEKLAISISGVISYIFIIFCFLGCMYPAIDLAAGEKERGTLETLLTSPVSNFQILIGKFLVVVLAGILSAVISVLGLYVGILFMREIPHELVQSIIGVLEFKSLALSISFLVPLSAFIAGIVLSLSLFAKSFKEAQSIINPCLFVFLIPAFVASIPEMSLNASTVFIPILNAILASKEVIITGSITPMLLAMVVHLSSIFLVGISLYGCSKIFEHEDVIFRSS